MIFTSMAANSADDRWALTPEALQALLALLDPDPDAAARRYEDIRTRLLRIFRWRGCAYPEELVDETMNRVAHKAAGGLELRSDDPFRYFCGVAQMIYKEILRDQRRQRDALAEMKKIEPPPPDPDPLDEDERLACLRRCMDELPDDAEELMTRYYTGDGRRRIRNRKALAESLGIAMNALRIRAYRLRNKLENCVRECVEA